MASLLYPIIFGLIVAVLVVILSKLLKLKALWPGTIVGIAFIFIWWFLFVR